MNYLAFSLLFLVALFAFMNWRHGFALCVFTALLQDPLRKLIPGEPVYLIIFVGVVFVASFVGASLSRVSLGPGGIVGWRQHVGQPFTWFLILLLIQATHSLVRFGNPLMTAIGFISYVAPICAITLAYRFALSRGELGVRRWMRFYVIAATFALATVYLEYSGVSWRALGEVGGGVMISGQGAYYKGNSGIFRASEIAAWHAATVACFAFILFWGRKFSPGRFLLAMGFIGFLIGIGVLTGRRKMIIEIVIFLSVYFCLLGWYQRGNARFAMCAALLGVASYATVVGVMEHDPGDRTRASERLSTWTTNDFGKYTERAQSVFEDAPRRLSETGIQPIAWAVDGYGWFGAGLGVGSQGGRHFGGEASGAAEGGLGKLTVELGVPGLLLTFWLLFSFVRYVKRILALLARASPRHANLAFGIVAFTIANVAAFTVAAQAYSDFFILLTLGWSFGFLLALPVLADEARNKPVTRAAREKIGIPEEFPATEVP